MTTYRECFEAAVDAAVAGATVLTSNTRSARAIYAAADARLRLGGAAWLSPDVLPYGAFVERLYSAALVAGAVERPALQREQELQLWREIIEHSPGGRGLLLPDAAAALASESFRTAAEYEIALDSAQMSASSDTRAFSGWAADFRRRLAEHRWSCPALFTRELQGCLSALQLPQQLSVFLAERTPAQRRFLDALTGAGVAVTIVGNDAAAEACASEAELAPLRYEFDGMESELRGAAQWARQQVEASPRARVGVLIFDLDRRLAQVESIFRSVLHPEHLLSAPVRTAFEIASPRALADYPVVECALGLLSLCAAPVGFDAFQATLRSPYLDAPPEAVARFLGAVKTQARRQVSFEEFARWLQDAAGEPARDVPELRAALRRLPKHAAFNSEQPVSYWARIAREILQAFGWPDGVRDAHGAGLKSEEFQCTRSWSELFAAVASLEALHWRCDFGGFVARLARAAAGRNFKPETLDAPIQIMNLAEWEGSVFDALWIAGSSDDQWPDSSRLSPLLPIALLKAAGVPVLSAPQADARVARITQRLLESAPRVVLSLARRSDDEREQRWSPLFAGIAPATEAIGIAPPLAESFASVALEAIADSVAPALAEGEIARGGSGLLQDQSHCPFRAFAIRRLLARKDEGPNEALAPTDRGKVVDRALQLIWEQLRDRDGLARADRAAIVARAVDAAMSSELPPAGDAWNRRFRQMERQRNIEVLEEWLTLEATRRQDFHVVDHQIAVEVVLGGLSLRGRLDRLDKIGDEHLVIDYKTGASDSVSAWRVPRPRSPQLPFYAVAMLREKCDVAGVSFATVRRGECAFKAYLRDDNLLPATNPLRRTFDGMPLDDYTELWEAELERIAASFVQGDAAVNPKIPPGKNHSPCAHCHLASLCRVGDAAVADFGDTEEESDG